MSVIITQKSVIKSIIDKGLEKYDTGLEKNFIHYLHVELLQKKVRYPMLEYATQLLFQRIAFNEQLKILDAIMQLHETGSSVIAGKMLQLRLTHGIEAAINSACQYIILDNVWYGCDTLAERVMGYALLIQPDTTLPILKRLSKENNKWLVRSIGVAAHYATKKGLTKSAADEMFLLLFSLSHLTEFHTKTGVGWGAKTIAKFHPEIIAKYQSKINETATVRPWFKTKIKIGLGRSEKYAGRYTS
jgi:3-methyladenine DNA glycosylase AlkD